jgi:hypothetical protein
MWPLSATQMRQILGLQSVWLRSVKRDELTWPSLYGDALDQTFSTCHEWTYLACYCFERQILQVWHAQHVSMCDRRHRSQGYIRGCLLIEKSSSPHPLQYTLTTGQIQRAACLGPQRPACPNVQLVCHCRCSWLTGQ